MYAQTSDGRGSDGRVSDGHVRARAALGVANYWGGIALDLACALAAIVIGFSRAPLAGAFAAATSGLVYYSLCEYAIHRYLYHRGRNVVTRAHAVHHDDPALVYGPPFVFGTFIAAPNALVAAALVGWPLALAFAGSLQLGYVQHGLVHHSAHRYPWLDVLGARCALRRHHALHHLDGRCNFGTSTRLWDRLFKTLVTR